MSTASETRYRVFVPASRQAQLPADAAIEEAYPAFAIITGPPATIDGLRKQYPVEELKTPEGAPPVPQAAGMATAADEPQKRGPYTLVMVFRSPVRQEWLDEVTAIGCEHRGALGASTIIVHCPTRRMWERLERVPQVSEVRPYVPDVKLSLQFFATLKSDTGQEENGVPVPASTEPSQHHIIPGTVVANFFTVAEQEAARRKLAREIQGSVSTLSATDLLIDLNQSDSPRRDLATLVTLAGLRSLEEKRVEGLFNDRARKTIAGAVIELPPEGLGLTGKGELIAVADTGLDTGDLATLHPDLRGRVRHMQSFPFSEFYRSLVVNPLADDGVADIHTGHGTHVAGSVLGAGARAAELQLEARIQGVAPEAELVFQAIEQTAEWNDVGLAFWLSNGVLPPPQSGLFAIPENLAVLFQAAYDQGARIHSNSWGERGPIAWGEYSRSSRQTDEFVYRHRDFLVVAAAGNEATATMPPGKPGSVVSPGTAKNCLTVGACGNDREGHPVDGLAPFSGRGPTKKGRRKPDVTAPGMFVLSTRSRCSSHPQWKLFDAAPGDYIFNGGTSMATPLVAGSAALVRQFLRESVGISAPSAALLKAAIIHCAQYRQTTAPAGQLADDEQGWGRVALPTLLNPPAPGAALFLDEQQGLFTGDTRSVQVQVTAPTTPLCVTLAYTDPPAPDLVNNLNLIVNSPDGSFFVGNDFDGDGTPDSSNNVEKVIIPTPALGVWTILVVGANVPQGPQDFALVISGTGLQRID